MRSGGMRTSCHRVSGNVVAFGEVVFKKQLPYLVEFISSQRALLMFVVLSPTT